MTKKSVNRQARDRLNADRDNTKRDLDNTYRNAMGLLSSTSDVYTLLREPEIQKNIENPNKIAQLITILTDDTNTLSGKVEALKSQTNELFSKPVLEGSDTMDIIQIYENYANLTNQFSLNITPVASEIMDAINVAAAKVNKVNNPVTNDVPVDSKEQAPTA